MFANVAILGGLFLALANIAACDPPFNNPPGVDVWCGKAYRATNVSFEPGGWLDPPALATNGSTSLRLTLNVYARYNFYLQGETRASFIVDTRVSTDPYGQQYVNETVAEGNEVVPFTELFLTVGMQNISVVNNTRVPVNASKVEIPFSLESVHELGGKGELVFEVIGRSPDGAQTYVSDVSIIVLPQRNDGGSMARIDQLHGGIHVSSALTNGTWKPLFPVGFYVRWDWISWLINPASNPVPSNLASNNTNNLKEYRNRGYNLIHAVPPGGWESFDDATLSAFLDICDELELYVMYDMRHTYLNLSSITRQLPRLQSHPSLLLYYTGDEPDGATDPLNGTALAYQRIRDLDPYHPVSLVLNCYNFYFKEYTAGADLILEDTYPLIVSSTFSPVYHTPCNRTYGDCGCDLCHAGDAEFPAQASRPFDDVSERVDKFYAYQRWLGQRGTKPVWGVPQWFFDANSFWSRWATREEAVVMALLRVTHGATGVVGWLFPTASEIEDATTDMARVLARPDVAGLLVGTVAQRVAPMGSGSRSGSGSGLDVAAWVRGGEVLVIVVWPEYAEGEGGFIKLPIQGGNVSHVEVLYGAAWEASRDGLVKDKVQGMEVSILRVQLQSSERMRGSTDAAALV